MGAGELKDELVALLPRLRRFAYGLSWSHDGADDLVQAACERCLRAHGRWRPGTRLDSWLYQIIRNLWLDELRKRRVRGPPSTWAAADLIGEDGVRVVEDRMMVEEARQALAVLPEDQRTVMLLVCVEELSYRDAAEILGVPIGTVMSRLARARRRMAAAFDGEEATLRVDGEKG